MKKLWLFGMMFLFSFLVLGAELDLRVNSYNKEIGEAVIEIQNYYTEPLHDLILTVDNNSLGVVLEGIRANTGKEIPVSLAPGTHVFKLESAEGFSVTKEMIVGYTVKERAVEMEEEYFETTKKVADEFEEKEKMKAMEEEEKKKKMLDLRQKMIDEYEKGVPIEEAREKVLEEEKRLEEISKKKERLRQISIWALPVILLAIISVVVFNIRKKRYHEREN